MSATGQEFKKYFPSDFELETTRVIVRPMRADDLPAFTMQGSQPETWKYFPKDLSTKHEMQQWVEEAMRDRESGKRMPFALIDKDTKEVCGSSSFGNFSFYDSRVEIGWSWLGPEYIGMGVNKHVKFALISFAIEVMKMERVEAKTDNLNERAKAGLLKVGMIPEGVLRSHMLMPGGRRRDSIYFSILKSEWPERRKNFFGEMI